MRHRVGGISNAAGVQVGYPTLISQGTQLATGSGAMAATGPVRTGITAILPRRLRSRTMPCAS